MGALKGSLCDGLTRGSDAEGEFVRLVEEIREKEREYDIDLTDWFVAEAEARGYCREL